MSIVALVLVGHILSQGESRGTQTDLTLKPPRSVIGSPGQGPVFGWVDDVCLIGRDTLAVADSRSPAIHLLARDGRVLMTVGGEGLGPGEYLEPRSVTYHRESLFVTDPRLRRVTQFSRTGSLVATFAVPGIPRDCKVFGDSLIVSTTGSRHLVHILSLSGAFEPFGVLERGSGFFGINQTRTSSALLELDRSILFIHFRNWNKIAMIDLDHPEVDVKVIEPTGPTIARMREEYEESVLPRAQQSGVGARALWSAFSRIAVLPSGHLLLEAVTLDRSSPTGRLMRGLVVDPDSGLEMGFRIKPEWWSSFGLWCLPDSSLIWADTERMQIRSYELPHEVLSLTAARLALDYSDRAGSPRNALLRVAVLLILLTIAVYLSRSRAAKST